MKRGDNDVGSWWSGGIVGTIKERNGNVQKIRKYFLPRIYVKIQGDEWNNNLRLLVYSGSIQSSYTRLLILYFEFVEKN